MSWLGSLSRGKQSYDIAIIGPEIRPPEPVLLEALAKNPKCAHLYFIPIGGQSQASRHNDIAYTEDSKLFRKPENPLYMQQLYAVDIKPLLSSITYPPELRDNRIDTEIKQLVAQSPATPIESNRMDLVISRHNHHHLFDHYLKIAAPKARFFTDPYYSDFTDAKFNLPTFKQSGIDMIAPCQKVANVDEALAFLKAHGDHDIVLKTNHSLAGRGVVHLYRNPSGQLWCDGPRSLFTQCDAQEEGHYPGGYPLEDLRFPAQGMLAMQWLEPSKGDIRAVAINGQIVGSYKRMPLGWLCNEAQGGMSEPTQIGQDITHAEIDQLNQVAQKLAHDYGQRWVSFDLLADRSGKRYLSEFNVGLTDDMNLLNPEQLANATDLIIKACERSHQLQPIPSHAQRTQIDASTAPAANSR